MCTVNFQTLDHVMLLFAMTSCHIVIFLSLCKVGETPFRNLRWRNQMLCYRNFVWFKCTYWLLFGYLQCYILHLIRSLWMIEMSLNELDNKINSMRYTSLVFLLNSIGPGDELLYQDGIYVFEDFMSPGWFAYWYWDPWALVFTLRGTLGKKITILYWFVIINCSSGTGENLANGVFCRNHRRWKTSI